MKFGLATRVTAAVMAILMAGLLMTATLSVHIFERTLSDFMTSRYEFEVNEIRRRIETLMDLGVAIPNLPGVSKILDEYRRGDSQILSIEIFDESGVVLFSTDPSFEGDLVTEEWVAIWRSRGEKQLWSRLDSDARVVGMPLTNNLGRNVGSIALRYSREFFDGALAAQTVRLMIIGATAVLFSIPVCILGALVLLRGLRVELRQLSDALHELANRCRDGEELGVTRVCQQKLAAFATAVLAAHDDIDIARSEVLRLDDEEAR